MREIKRDWSLSKSVMELKLKNRNLVRNAKQKASAKRHGMSEEHGNLFLCTLQRAVAESNGALVASRTHHRSRMYAGG